MRKLKLTAGQKRELKHLTGVEKQEYLANLQSKADTGKSRKKGKRHDRNKRQRRPQYVTV